LNWKTGGADRSLLTFCSCLERSSTRRIAYLLIIRAYEMPRYFFDIKNGHRLIDPTGLDCVDDVAALRSARMIAQQIAKDANPDLPRRISVLDEDRSEIGTVLVDHEDEIKHGIQRNPPQMGRDAN
jgi:hypothetical protein